MKTRKRILVVDDNTEFCENITDILELEGYETIEIYDGFDALDAVKEDGFYGRRPCQAVIAGRGLWCLPKALRP